MNQAGFHWSCLKILLTNMLTSFITPAILIIHSQISIPMEHMWWTTMQDVSCIIFAKLTTRKNKTCWLQTPLHPGQNLTPDLLGHIQTLSLATGQALFFL